MTDASRYCRGCGRRMEARRRWRDLDAVRFCSAACRRRGVRRVDRALEGQILALLRERPAASSICPSEVARAVAGREADGWRDLMEPARRAARRLALRGLVVISQGARVVDPGDFRGPVRVRLTPAGRT